MAFSLIIKNNDGKNYEEKKGGKKNNDRPPDALKSDKRGNVNEQTYNDEQTYGDEQVGQNDSNEQTYADKQLYSQRCTQKLDKEGSVYTSADWQKSTANVFAVMIAGHHGKLRIVVQSLYYYLRLLRLNQICVANQLLSIVAEELDFIEQYSMAMEKFGFSPVYETNEQCPIAPLNKVCLLSDKVRKKEAKKLLLDVISLLTAHVSDCSVLLGKIEQKGFNEKVKQAITKEKENIDRLLILAKDL